MRKAVKSETINDRPVMILTISNGAGHTRAAEAIAEALLLQGAAEEAHVPAVVLDVADYMTKATRFTHVTAYLWLIKHAPGMWDLIDRYQKRQTHTSPAWYYRRGCHSLFELARRLRPRALITTEVGCCEIAALIKHDLKLNCPLVAVNVNYDADRAWVRQEVDLYCVATPAAQSEMIAHGAQGESVMAWGVPLSAEFSEPPSRQAARINICEWLELDPSSPILLIAGGSEGMGRIEEIAERLARLERFELQLIILAGRNGRLKARCEKLARAAEGALRKRIRVLGWTERVPELMCAAELLISKLGNTFDEAMACELPVIALEPPPGSERVQYQLLEEWNVGRAVHTMDEMAEAVTRLLVNRNELEAMRQSSREHRMTEASARIARWVLPRINAEQQEAERQSVELAEAVPLLGGV